MKKQGWAIDDLMDAKRIAGVASKLRFAVGAGYILMLIEGGINVAETWHHTHNWSATLKEADIEIVDIATGVLATAVAGLVLVAVGFTAPEWITCLIVGSAGMALGELFGKELINPFIDKEWKTSV